jgi:cytochrome c556
MLRKRKPKRNNVTALLEEIMENFDALNAAIAKLQADVNALIASKPASNQASIDAAQKAVEAIDGVVVAATPPA